MAAQQKRLISAANSKLGKADIVAIMRKHEAWALLPPETRQHLYTLLPAARPFEGEFDTDVHPLTDQFKYHIETELRRWQDDLVDGKETQKWRNEAMQAGRDREAGAFDEYSEARHEEHWGRKKSTVSERKALSKSSNGAMKDTPMDGIEDEVRNGLEKAKGGEIDGLGVGYGDEGETDYPQSRSPSILPPNPYVQSKPEDDADEKDSTAANGDADSQTGESHHDEEMEEKEEKS